MKPKGNSKYVGKPKFWPKNEDKVPSEIKEMIFQQYYSRDTLFIYCDMSMKHNYPTMAVACSYIKDSLVQVKQQYVHPPRESVSKNIYGELKAILFALTHFEKYIGDCSTIIFYSDVRDIEKFLTKEIVFKKNDSLSQLQEEIHLMFRKIKNKHTNKNITVCYLSHELRKYNPFYKSAHNAAKRMLNG
ncbi:MULTISPECIES: hypothetical protein [Bacillota]|uniref:hypothetical protein n=1 Tax=Bacillota TaxID=1239 RepID=UPI0039EE92F6